MQSSNLKKVEPDNEDKDLLRLQSKVIQWNQENEIWNELCFSASTQGFFMFGNPNKEEYECVKFKTEWIYIIN